MRRIGSDDLQLEGHVWRPRRVGREACCKRSSTPSWSG